MEYKKIIPVAMAILCMGLLISFDINEVFALSVVSNTYNTPVTIGGIGYSSSLEYIASLDSNSREIDFIDANDLTLAGTAALGADAESFIAVDGNIIPTDGNLAYFLSTKASTTPDVMNFHKIDMNTFVVTTLTNNTNVMNGCAANGSVRVGDNLYAYYSGALCSNRGLYLIDTSVTSGSDWLVTVAIDGSNFGFEDGCYSNGAGKLAFTHQLTNFLRVFNLAGTRQDLDLGAVVNRIYCIPSTDLVLVSSSAGNWVKLVDIGGSPTLVATTTVTGAMGIVKHADNIFVSRSGSTSASICQYSASVAMSCDSTVTINTSALMINGNATAFYALNNPSGNNGIAYAVIGLESIEEDNEDIINGVNCALPENAQKLTCRLGAQGGQLPTFSDLVGQTFGNSTNNIFVQLGLVPAGSNIQTNGVGYGITLVGLGIMISMFALASGMELNRIPTFVWFLGTLAVIGLSTGFGFVEPLWLILSILVIIALASAKILSTLEIGGFR